MNSYKISSKSGRAGCPDLIPYDVDGVSNTALKTKLPRLIHVEPSAPSDDSHVQSPPVRCSVVKDSFYIEWEKQQVGNFIVLTIDIMINKATLMYCFSILCQVLQLGFS